MTLWFVLGCAGMGLLTSGVLVWLDRPKPQPPAVRLHPDLLAEFRSELVHNASKRIVRADFQRGNFK